MNGPSARNRQRANSGEPAQSATHDRAGSRSGCRAFGCFGVFLSGKILGAIVVRKQD